MWLHRRGRRKKLREQRELWFAAKLALHFRIPDFFKILDEWPESLVAYWQAVYDREPWDAVNLKTLAECEYKAPEYGPQNTGGKRRRMNGSTY